MSLRLPSFSSVPPADFPVPAPIREVAHGLPVQPVWANEVGGATFRLGAGPEARYAKWAPADSGIDLAAEAARMRWAGTFVAVPQVLELDSDGEGTWLVTAALDGDMAVTDRWKQEPATAVRVIGEALRAFHDALPVTECPFTASAQERVAEAERNAVRLGLRSFHPDFEHLAPAERMQLGLRERGEGVIAMVDRAVRRLSEHVATYHEDWHIEPGVEVGVLCRPERPGPLGRWP